jgi:DNA polymerase-1
MPSQARTLYLVDGSAQVHRAYFAIRGLSTSRGLPTNATFGFTTMLKKLLEDEDPQWIGICFDVRGRTFRHEEYPEYKANRPPMADDLAVQLPYIRRVCEAFQLPIIEQPGVEADDVIATLARQAVAEGLRVLIVTGDKDLLQLVSDQVRVLNPGREGSGATLYDAAAVESKLGVPPPRVVDLLALLGDAVDNVPGVPGIGEKGARDLLRQFGSVEAALENAESVKRKAYREGLLNHADAARLSKQLVTLRVDVPVELDLELLRRREPDREALRTLFTELEFAALARGIGPAPSDTQVEHETLASGSEVTAAIATALAAGRVAVTLLTNRPDPMRAEPVGVALCARPGHAVYLPLGHSPLELPDPPPRAAALQALGKLLADPDVAKLSANAKHDRIVLGRAGLAWEGLAFDALLASYLLDPGQRQYSLDAMAQEFLGEVVQAGKPGESDAEGWASVDAAARAAAQDADVTFRLAEVVSSRLEEEGLVEILESMELPLVEVLADMQQAGVKVDGELLARMSRELESRIEALTAEIHDLAGGPFNVNSPVQLREVLFERLGLRAGKKTAKTRAASTREEVLEELAVYHELPRRILDYRGLQKLKSTYVDALPQLIHPETGRIHASFNQTVAATGRISSSDPNLQNIPIRSAEGRRIREAFVAEPGHLLLSADYSQIELRILAHLSRDRTLIETFERGEDVHDRTAREVFGPFSPLPPDEQRRRSKMINYALIYGKTAFTLAKDIGVTRREADEFINAYFARYPGVEQFIERTIADARETGAVRTLLGRLRRLPEIRSKRPQLRMEAERQARNTPVQGSAADLIKKAMIDLHRELRARRLRSRLILQIHDELLVEVPEAEADEVLGLVKEVMEGALSLAVPLVVDAALGRTWSEAH